MPTSLTSENVFAPDLWQSIPLQHPPAKTALETARMLALYTQMMVEDDQHFQAGQQFTRIPPDLGVESIRRQVDHWPVTSLERSAETPPWPQGLGPLYQAERHLQWVNEPGRRLWPTVIKLTRTAARLESEAQAYYLGHRPELPADPPGLSTAWPDQVVQALGSLPEQVQEIRDTPEPTVPKKDPNAFDPDAPDFSEQNPWHLGLIDPDHLAAWRVVDGRPEWWTNVQGTPSLWVRPDQAIRALREAQTPFVGANGGAVTLAPEAIQQAWRAEQVQSWVQAAKTLAVTWQFQAVNHTQAIAYRVGSAEDPTQPAELFINPHNRWGAPKLFPLAETHQSTFRQQWTEEFGIQWARRPTETTLSPSVKLAVDQAIVRVKAAQQQAIEEPLQSPDAAAPPLESPPIAPPTPWQIGRVDLGQIVAWRPTPQGSVEWWSPTDAQMPLFPSGKALETALTEAGEPVTPLTSEAAVPAVPDSVLAVWRAQSLDRLVQFTRAIPEPDPVVPPPPTMPGQWRAQAIDAQRILAYQLDSNGVATILMEPDQSDRIHWLTRDQLKSPAFFHYTASTLGMAWETPEIHPPADLPTAVSQALAAQTWTVQAVDHTRALAYQQQSDGPATLLHKRSDPQAIEWLDQAQFLAPGGAEQLSRVFGVQWSDGTIRDPAAMPESVQVALNAAVLQPAPSTPEPAAAEPASAAPWHLQKLTDDSFVCYRWDTQGRPENWHAPNEPKPAHLLVWTGRQTQQWLADPEHAAQVQHDFDPTTTPIAVKASLAMTPKGPAAPAFALPKF